jgi:hypothetical protein
MDELNQIITDYFEEHGYTKETTMCIIRDIKEELAEHAIRVEITMVEDGNSYPEDEYNIYN